MREHKAASVELTASDEGAFVATFSRLNVVDADKDVTFPGAFKSGQAVRIARWGHNWGDLPVGKGVINADQTRAWVDGRFFLDTIGGKDTYTTVKQLGELQEWSYGYDVLGETTDPADLAPFPGAERGLKALDVFEVSPVMLGAGVGTGTDSIKGAIGIRPLRAAAARIRQKAAAASASPEVAAAMARLDAAIDTADEEADSLMDMLGIPDPDETPADEADDVPKGYRFIDHARDVAAFFPRAKALAALRGKEGRALSAANRTRLSALVEQMRAGMADVEKLLADTAPADDGKDALTRIHLSLLREPVYATR